MGELQAQELPTCVDSERNIGNLRVVANRTFWCT